MIDLNTKILTMRGTPMTLSFPRDEEEKKKDETVANVLLSCLAAYPVRDKKEVFLVNHLAEKILAAQDGQIEFSEAHTKFLGDVLYDSTFKQDKKTGDTKGVYLAPLVAQVFRALGIEE